MDLKLYPEIDYSRHIKSYFHMKDLKYFVNEKESSKDNLEIMLRDAIGDKEGLVVLHCDKDVPVEELVNIGSNSVFMRSLTESEVKYTPDFNELKQYNKKKGT